MGSEADGPRLSANGFTPKKNPKKQPIADSWDDEASSDEEAQLQSDLPTDLNPPLASPAPPPAPPAPTHAAATPLSDDSSSTAGSSGYYAYDPESYSRAGERDASSTDGGQRQAKTDAVARRMIAHALGVRSTRSTKEQKEYEASLKKKVQEENEARRRAEVEREKAKAAMWED
ncbi:hypothetical protein TWF696_008087 [Orbilia brochopaga]|uniref:Uncharacterized protein n=1 Tax=Orbilia brochopaga TaxID=3140254 RepID=A0AAV9UMZ8_9PEZI